MVKYVTSRVTRVVYKIKSRALPGLVDTSTVRRDAAHVKVFISWSGALSQQVAVALRDWLPSVLQAVTPYVSSEDIDKGARWNTDIAQELEGSSFGILCVTPDNIDAPWVNFEAGALSKSLDQSRVAPFLLGMQRTDVKGPLLQFQSTVYERDDVLKLVRSMNAACDAQALDEQRVEGIFDVWWPKLQEALEKVTSTKKTSPSPSRSTDDIVQEVLELVRGQQAMLSDLAFSTRERELHPSALSDAFEAWHRLNAILRNEPESASPRLLGALERLRPSIEYIFSETGADRPHRRTPTRSRNRPDDEPAGPGDQS